MDHNTNTFLQTAMTGNPVFINMVREAYNALDSGTGLPVTLDIVGIDGQRRRVDFRIPRFLDWYEPAQNFVKEYVAATVYNAINTVGAVGATLSGPEGGDEIGVVQAHLENAFCTGHARHERKGYGRSLNVVERMRAVLHPSTGFGVFHFGAGTPALPPPSPESAPSADTVFIRAATRLQGKTLLGMDIGGTDIKLALAVDGQLAALKEFDWFPGLFTTAVPLLEQIELLVRLMALVAAMDSADPSREDRQALAAALGREASLNAMQHTIDRLGERYQPARFDAIGISFPDVVVNDRIVGGETPKTIGMRENLRERFEDEFYTISGINIRLESFTHSEGMVAIINDGPMAAFTAGVEMAHTNPKQVADGVLAHSLGTDLGTGWVDCHGRVPDIPLEIYNYIIDLGSYPEREFPAVDMRSVNNSNTGLPGTVQKYASQSGVFRLAIKYLPFQAPALWQKIMTGGFVVPAMVNGLDGWQVASEPEDMRKPFLEFLMNQAERGDVPAVERIFQEVGFALGVASMEMNAVLPVSGYDRWLFGRMVKNARCFTLVREGAMKALPSLTMRVADETMANSPLMQALNRRAEVTVAQFAQAVGAIYYANLRTAVDPE